jgi:recombination protein RecT
VQDNQLVVLERQLAPLAPHFAQVLGTTMPAERLIRTVAVSCERLPKLFECDRQSLFNAAMSAACLGLEVDGVTGQAYLIPFKGRAQLVVGYKGYNTLAARSGLTITGGVVREGDDFDYELGDRAYVRHKPKLGAPGRKIVAAWAVAAAHGRPPVVQVLGIDEILAIKAKSPGAQRSDSPWNDPAIGFPAMAEKSAKRRLARSMPLNVMQTAARLDEAVEEQGKGAWIDRDRGLIVDGEFTTLPHRDTQTPTAADLIGQPSPHVPPHPSDAADAAPPDEPPAPGGAVEGPDSQAIALWDANLGDAAAKGTDELKKFWATVPADIKPLLKVALDRRHKATAAEADAR